MATIQPYMLAIDCSTSVLRVGLSLEDGKVACLENRGRYRHAEFIFRLIEDLLRQNGVEKAKLSAIIVSTGPGSFTGLRVGMASAKGMAVSLQIPLIGISTFSAIAGRLFEKFGKTGVIVPSRRDEYYFALIESDKFNDRMIRVATIKEIISLAGDINLLGIDIDTDKKNLLDCQFIEADEFTIGIEDFIFRGQQEFESAATNDISRLEPLYIQKFPAKTGR